MLCTQSKVQDVSQAAGETVSLDVMSNYPDFFEQYGG